MRRKSTKKILILIFFILILFISVGYSILKQEVKINGKATINPQEENKEYIVTYVIDAKWYSNNKYYYKITMTLLNNTDKSLEGWKISTTSPKKAKIEAYYNVSCYIKNNHIEFENVSYNAHVPSKQTVSFEFQISTTEENYKPNNIIINSNESEKPPETEKPEENNKKIEIQSQKNNGWQVNDYYFSQYTITVKNIGDVSINSWQFDCELYEDSSVEQIWNAIATKQNNIYTFKNSSFNGFIDVNSSISFGVIIKSKKQEIQFDAINIILK